MKPRIMVYGSYCVGMTMSCQTFPVAGQTVLGKNFQQLHGGKGANQAIAAARMGGDVCYVSCVGKDALGDAAMALFEAEGLDARIRRSEAHPTGVGFVMVDQTGENRILINFDACMEISADDIDALSDELGKCKILLMQLEADIPTIAYAAKKANEMGVMVILNPAPYREIPPELLENVDVITPNESEAKQMLGISPEVDVPIEELANQLLQTKIPHVIITLGEKGSILANRSGILHIPVEKKVTAVDTTGAGDTFAGSLAVALGEGFDYPEAIAFANRAAGISVTRHGVVESIPYRNEL